MRPEVLNEIFAPITSLKGVGSGISKVLSRLVGKTVGALYWHLPTGVIHRRWIENLAHAYPGEIITTVVTVRTHQPPHHRFSSNTPYRICCQDATGHFLDLVYFRTSSSYLQSKFAIDQEILISGKFDKFNMRWQMIHPDYVGLPSEKSHWQGYESIYPLTKGLTQKYLYSFITQALKRCPDLPEWLDPGFCQQQKWFSWRDSVRRAHTVKSEQELDPCHPVRQRLAYDELLAYHLSLQLIRYYHSQRQGRSLQGTGDLTKRTLAQLPFALTSAQDRVLKEIHQDMTAPTQMIRLLQGDVGSGKTIVAFLAMLHAIEAGTQAALLAPTEILAQQHFTTLSQWATPLGLKCALLTSRLHSSLERKVLLEALAKGEIQCVIGTHALLQEDVSFKDLSLAVVDEQHRFGVDQRLALIRKGEKVDILVMTATPIPRTLQLTTYGDLDVSRLDEKPKGRQETITRVVALSRLEETFAGIKRLLQQDQQIYWICPLIQESEVLDLAAAEQRYQSLAEQFPNTVGLIHGQLKSQEKEEIMQRFAQGEIKILVATTVIEVGVDVPAANVIVIEHAERFGLAQLHQLRGRVGRGQQAGVCLLLYGALLTPTARERLNIMRQTNDGFLIAEHDLKLRGGGDVLGWRQSGVPQFRVANLEVHMDLLQHAQREACQILAQDPYLHSQRGQALRILLHLFEKDKVVTHLYSG